mmetsp:Transcript_81732/g.216886  ORF Transcript_81732/g.216886 Transcript_81732/m.216886 type:complete len:341 (+) Transcript_81732:1560-2582(+)
MPRSSASREIVDGGSWQWSPQSAICLAPRQMIGTMAETSVACATSSIRIAWNLKPASAWLPAVVVVAQRTSAASTNLERANASCFLSHAFLRRHFLRSASHSKCSSLVSSQGSSPSSSRSEPSSSSLFFLLASLSILTMLSRQTGSRISRTFSGRPIRHTLTPAFARPSAMLSTAMLHSDVASKGVYFICFAHMVNILTDVWVLPVPGGPCTMVRRLERALVMAFLCATERSGRVLTISLASASRPMSMPSASSSASASVARLARSSSVKTSLGAGAPAPGSGGRSSTASPDSSAARRLLPSSFTSPVGSCPRALARAPSSSDSPAKPAAICLARSTSAE